MEEAKLQRSIPIAEMDDRFQKLANADFEIPNDVTFHPLMVERAGGVVGLIVIGGCLLLPVFLFSIVGIGMAILQLTQKFNPGMIILILMAGSIAYGCVRGFRAMLKSSKKDFADAEKLTNNKYRLGLYLLPDCWFLLFETDKGDMRGWTLPRSSIDRLWIAEYRASIPKGDGFRHVEKTVKILVVKNGDKYVYFKLYFHLSTESPSLRSICNSMDILVERTRTTSESIAKMDSISSYHFEN